MFHIERISRNWLSPFTAAPIAFVCLVFVRPPAQAATEKILYAFKPTESNQPANLLNVNGLLFGSDGGFQTYDGLFKVTPSGNVHQVPESVKSFARVSLTSVGKVFYGVAEEGGDPTCNCGYVFSMTEQGAVTDLYNFTGGNDGASPTASLINVGGTLYGTTFAGGSGNCSPIGFPAGCGTVFSITPDGSYTQLYAFKGTSQDGAQPGGPLTSVNGLLFGTTTAGGTANNGTLFSLAADGTETVLHAFTAKKDGNSPGSGLLLLGTTFYGTTYYGGPGGSGVAFSIGTDGKNEKVLHAFSDDGTDGQYPVGALIEVNGLLYGVTFSGGQYSQGTMYSLTTSGQETIVYAFKGINTQDDTDDAASPNSTLVYLNGSFYGTSQNGGKASRKQCFEDSCGTIFEVTP